MIAVADHPVDPDAAVRLLRERFPGIAIWYGATTRSYWALVADTLYEAASPTGLNLILDSVAPTRRGP